MSASARREDIVTGVWLAIVVAAIVFSWTIMCAPQEPTWTVHLSGQRHQDADVEQLLRIARRQNTVNHTGGGL